MPDKARFHLVASQASPLVQIRSVANWPGRSREVLLTLAKADACSSELGVDSWNFALPLLHLFSLGVDHGDLRWLVLRGYATFGDRVRHIQPGTRVAACANPGFIITEAGRLVTDGQVGDIVTLRAAVPTWDSKLRQLSFDGQLVKRFRLPSPHQERVLFEFQEEGWPAVIDDPLPFLPRQRAKERLHVTIRHLNSSQVNRLLRFRGNGTGEAILWEPIVTQSLAEPSTAPGLRRAA